jgi:antitoxin component YwqK of YwqJK toxin-antitoxin module
MSRPLIAFFLILGVLPGCADALLYKSNQFGMLLLPIEPYRRDESEWVLEVHATGKDEVRRLYDRGSETRRWEISWTERGTRRVERELFSGVLAARRVYDAAGSLLQEEQYDKGVLVQKSVLTYSEGHLSRLRMLASDGSLVDAAQYLYGKNGTLREVRHTDTAGDVRVSSFVFGPAGVSEERTSSKDTLFISRYDARGRLTNVERRKGEQTQSREDFFYRPETDLLLSSTESLPQEGKAIERRYDDGGRLASEATTASRAVVEEGAYTRDAQGRVTARTRRSSHGLETWKYALDDQGKVSREEYFLRGSLQKVTAYGQGKLRTEEIYKDEELFLKVYYDGDTRLKEEVYSGGKVLRERKRE